MRLDVHPEPQEEIFSDGLVRRGHEGCESVTANPGDRILGAEDLQDFGRLLQELIPGSNAFALIDGKQVVHPYRDDTDRELPSFFKPIQLLLEIGPIVKAGQHIVETHIPEFFFRFPEIVDVDRQADDADDVSRIVPVEYPVILSPAPPTDTGQSLYESPLRNAGRDDLITHFEVVRKLLRRQVRKQLRECLADDPFERKAEGFAKSLVGPDKAVLPVRIENADAGRDGIQDNLQVAARCAAIPRQFAFAR